MNISSSQTNAAILSHWKHYKTIPWELLWHEYLTISWNGLYMLEFTKEHVDRYKGSWQIHSSYQLLLCIVHSLRKTQWHVLLVLWQWAVEKQSLETHTNNIKFTSDIHQSQSTTLEHTDSHKHVKLLAQGLHSNARSLALKGQSYMNLWLGILWSAVRLISFS